MGQLVSSEEEVSEVKDFIGSVLYNAMFEGGAVPDLRVVHPRLLSNHGANFDQQASLQEQLKQLQSDIGNRAPTYLRDLIGRLSSFSDEPRLAGLVGLVVTMVMDMAYTSSSYGKGKSTGSSSSKRVFELQELMEEYLKRVRINLNDKNKLIKDSMRLEAKLSLTLTQLKSCLLGGDCNSRSVRHWASGAAFHTQMLVHLASFEGQTEPLSARTALEQYKEDLTQILLAYRHYKLNTLSIIKCRGGLLQSCDPSSETPEEGSMTGLTVTDREMGKSITIPLSVMEAETGRRRKLQANDTTAESTPINLELITSDQYAQAYLDHLFSDKGPVAELQNYFINASDNLRELRTYPGSKNRTELRNGIEQNDEVKPEKHAEVINDEQSKEKVKGGEERKVETRGGQREVEECKQKEEELKLSIVETQQDESLSHSLHSASCT